MATVSKWGLCPAEIQTEQFAPSQFTGRDSGFLMGRLRTSRALRRFTLRYIEVPPVWWDEALLVYRSTYGGSLRVGYTPPGSPEELEVRFASAPQAMTKNTGASISFEVVFEEVGA
jgi:hypothetical protein